ncbi:MAG: hypothetical protein WD712_03035 [Candidatus Spechtbacterales bacterium]
MAITIAGLARASEFEATLFRLLAEEGLNDEALKTLVNDRSARAQLVQFANTLTGSSGTTSSYQRARDILGDDFISPQEIAEAIGVSYTEAQLASLTSTLPEKEVLQWARDNGFAVVAGPPSEMNLLDIHELNTDLFFEKNDPWFADKRQKFARSDTVGTTWLVIRKDPVPNSTRKTWSEQQDQLSDNERVPNVAEATWFFTAYAKVRGIRLVPHVYVRTSSVDSGGYHVSVGDFSENCNISI